MAGFIIPGSDTCVKISGYIVGQFTFGNLNTGYGGGPHVGNSALVVDPTKARDTIGWDTRLNFSLDVRQDTAYGVARGYFDAQWDAANGHDALEGTAIGTTASQGGIGGNNVGYLNHAYLQWAGLTVGKANSFFSFYGGGEAWANVFSPDQNGFNQPILFAYTATFGGGFSASLAAQSPGSEGPSGGGTNVGNLPGYAYGGQKAPDVVANIRVDQGWGSAQLSGVAHNVNVSNDGFANLPGGSDRNTWGYGINGGVKFNLPSFGPGDYIEAQATYTQSAIWFSGIPDGNWGENGAVNGNGIAMPVGDTFNYTNALTGAQEWATPTAWSMSVTAEHHFSPVFSLDPEFSYAQLHWNQGGAGGNLAANSESFIAGLVGHWDPVPHIDFELEIIYQDTHQSTPGLYNGVTGVNAGIAFPKNTDGFDGRFQVTRDF
jgi:hypothetical protein